MAGVGFGGSDAWHCCCVVHFGWVYYPADEIVGGVGDGFSYCGFAGETFEIWADYGAAVWQAGDDVACGATVAFHEGNALLGVAPDPGDGFGVCLGVILHEGGYCQAYGHGYCGGQGGEDDYPGGFKLVRLVCHFI